MIFLKPEILNYFRFLIFLFSNKMTSKSVQKLLNIYEIKYTLEKEKSKEKVNFTYIDEGKKNKTKIRGSIFIDIFNYYISDLVSEYKDNIKTIPKLNAFLSLVPMLKAAYEQNKDFQNNYIFEEFWKGHHLWLLDEIAKKYPHLFNSDYLGIIEDCRWMKSRDTYNKEDVENARTYFKTVKENLLKVYKLQTVKNIFSYIDLCEIFFNQNEYKLNESNEIEIEEIEDF